MFSFVGWFCIGLVSFVAPQDAGWWATPAYAIDTIAENFVSWIEDIVDSMPGSGSEGFSVPSSAEKADFLSAVEPFLDEDWTTANTRAASVDYEVIQINDTGWANETFYGLQPVSGNTDGRGYYFLRHNSAVSCALVIEAPHPKYDIRTGVLASELFREVGARAFLLAGTHRCANSAASGCSGTTTACGGGSLPYKESDMAHTADSFFQVFHEEASEETVNTRVIQVHGFSSDPDEPEFTVSDGTTTDSGSGTYLPNWFTTTLEAKIAGY